MWPSPCPTYGQNRASCPIMGLKKAMIIWSTTFQYCTAFQLSCLLFANPLFDMALWLAPANQDCGRKRIGRDHEIPPTDERTINNCKSRNKLNLHGFRSIACPNSFIYPACFSFRLSIVRKRPCFTALWCRVLGWWGSKNTLRRSRDNRTF